MKKIGMFGYFAFGKEDFGGQPVKTNNLYSALLDTYINEEIDVLDTAGKKNKIVFIIRTIYLIINSKNLIIMPAHNGIKYFPKLYFFVKSIFNRKCKIHYVVIGGWLPKLLDNNNKLLNQVSKFDFIYVETNTMKRHLNRLGLQNIFEMKNIKKLEPIFQSYEDNNEFIFCYYSRVIPEKGIEEAIKAIYEVNKYYGKSICKLHIYGPLSQDYMQKIYSLIDNVIIVYRGVINTNLAPSFLSKYYMQLFPTKYYTEGIPGSIIDSFYSGLPVIASSWESVSDVLTDGYDGLIYSFNNLSDLVSKIIWSINNQDKVSVMREHCIENSMYYQPSNVIKILIDNID